MNVFYLFFILVWVCDGDMLLFGEKFEIEFRRPRIRGHFMIFCIYLLGIGCFWLDWRNMEKETGKVFPDTWCSPEIRHKLQVMPRSTSNVRKRKTKTRNDEAFLTAPFLTLTNHF